MTKTETFTVAEERQRDGNGELIRHELINRRGERVRLLNFGARIARIELLLDGAPRSVVLAYPSDREHLSDRFYMGCTTGRFSNRISGAKFEIDGHVYRLDANAGTHQLHGGTRGFDRRFWTVKESHSSSVEFHLLSKHGDQGFPGNLDARVRYTWDDERRLRIDLRATTDQATHVNLGNHAYFNLDGPGRDIFDHWIRMPATQVLDVSHELIPTGGFVEVDDTDLDLREARSVRLAACSGHPLIDQARGLDLAYVLDEGEPAAELWSSTGDLKLSVTTSYPSLHLYSGQDLSEPWRPFAGLCLEAQFFPDSPNQSGSDMTLLRPGMEYHEWIVYQFEPRDDKTRSPVQLRTDRPE